MTDPRFSRLLLLTAVTIPIKAWALWRSARNGSKPWFIALLIINTFGIVDLIYLFYFSKPKVIKD